MLVIRMQRSGRKGHAMFRVVVQDSRRTPTSGKLVAQLGSYDPHAKTVIVNKEKAQFYLDHGAKPSERVARLLGKEGVKLPNWVVLPEVKKRTVRNADKRRSTRPEAPAEEAPVKPEPVAETEEKVAEDAAPETAETEATPAALEAETETAKAETTDATEASTSEPIEEKTDEVSEESTKSK